MNYFPSDQEEISLIKFISKYQYLNINYLKYFFKSQQYYRRRVSKLIEEKYLRKINNNIVLAALGIKYVISSNFEYNALNRNKKYLPRLLYMSGLGAFFYKSDTVKYIPSFNLKDKEVFTTTSRRFVGVLEINGIDYLLYHIGKEHDNKYIAATIYDIQKERKYRNVIILVDNIKRINIDDFSFGMNQVLIVEDNKCNREKLKYLNSINWNKIIRKNYRNNVVISEYNFCDYTDHKNKYIVMLYFLDSEKITRVKYFLRENRNRNADIICTNELKEELKNQITNANYVIVDFEKYIDKERKIYD